MQSLLEEEQEEEEYLKLERGWVGSGSLSICLSVPGLDGRRPKRQTVSSQKKKTMK